MQIKEVPAASLRHPRMAIETIAGVELPEWDLVAEQMDRVEVAAGERLATPGKSDPYVYFVTAGLVKVQLNPSPSDPAQGVTLFPMEEGDLFAAPTVLQLPGIQRAVQRGLHPRSSYLAEVDRDIAMHTLIALEPSVVLRCPGSVIAELAERHQPWAQLLATIALLNNAALAQDLASQKFPAEQRYRTLATNRPDLVRRLPQREIASLLNITDSALSRIAKRVRSAAE